MRSFFLLLLGLLVLFSSVSSAQTPPSIVVPSRGNFYVDPESGNKVWVVTDNAMCPGGAHHHYSYWPVWNANGSHLMVYCINWMGSNTEMLLIRDSDLTVIGSAEAGNGISTTKLFWSWTDPNVYYAHKGTRIIKVNPFTGVTTTVKDFAGTTFFGRPMGNAELEYVSFDDRYLLVSGDFNAKFMFTYDMQTGQILGAFDKTTFTFFDEAVFTKENKVWVTGDQSGFGSWVYAIDFSSRILISDAGHHAHGQLQNGRYVAVKAASNKDCPPGSQAGNPPGQGWKPTSLVLDENIATASKADDPFSSELLRLGCNYPGQHHFGHFSWNNVQNDHFFMSGPSYSGFASDPFAHSITRARLQFDASNNLIGDQIDMLARHRTIEPPGGGYWEIPRVSCNRQGTKCLFDSNMKQSTQSATLGIQSYIVEFTAASGGGPPPPDTTPPAIFSPQPSAPLPAGMTSTTISADTNEQATCKYSTTAGQSYSAMPNTLTASGNTHSAPVSGLSNGNIYTYYIRCKDASPNQNENLIDFPLTFSVSSPAASAAILLNTSLGSLTEVSTPNVGTGTGSSVAGATFTTGQIGNGAQFTTGSAQYIRYQQTASGVQNVELDKGTVEFWYRPSYNHNDGVHHNIFSTGSWNTPGTVSLLKRGGNELSAFLFPSPSGFMEVKVNSSSYSWTANQWVRLRVTWDTTISGQMLRIYVNSVEPAYSSSNANGPVSAPVESTSNHIYVGTRSATDTAPASGVIDELVIASALLTPGQPWPSPGGAPMCGSTPINTCISGSPPSYCSSSATVVNNCQQCGCPSGQQCNATTQACYSPAQQTCSDGTPYGQCSSVNIGKLCSSGNLVDACSTCGCAGQQCNTFTQQCQSSISYSKLTFRGKLIKNTISQQPCASCLITIGLQGTQNTTTTDAAGSFMLELYRTTTPGNYIFDITVVDGATTYSFKRRGIIT